MFLDPYDVKREFERRLKIHKKFLTDPALRAAAHLVYKYDVVQWVNDWGVTFDPRAADPMPRVLPFNQFQRQKEFLQFLSECLRDKENGLVEKCRDMGATWDAVHFAVWLWRYYPGSTIGFGSRKEEYVDHKDDPKAIFPKIRQLLDHMPVYMKPRNFKMERDATYMRIINRENGSAITGEAGSSIGRGGRTTIYFKDESAHYEQPELIEAALGDNTDVQIDISSVNGSANVFYRRRKAGEVWEPNKQMTPGKTRVFIFDWRDHPKKDQNWYEMRRKKAEDEALLHIFAQEVDRDYTGSKENIIIPQAWVDASIDAHIKLGIKADGVKIAGQDIADGGHDKNALIGRHGIVCIYGDHWGGDAGDAAKRAIPKCIELGIREIDYDTVGVGTGFKAAAKMMRENGAIKGPFQVVPWNGGYSVLDPEKRIIPNDKESPTNEDQYLNLKAQSWFRARTRFYKTWRVICHGENFPHDELISLSSKITCLSDLKMQLSQATYDSNSKGKTIVDKQPDGESSPHLADALVICYNPIKQPVGFFST